MTAFDNVGGILDGRWAIPQFTRDEVIALLRGDGEWLKGLARRKTLAAFGEQISIRASCEITNYCRKSCSFCGLARDNRDLTRYRMTVDEIKSAIDDVARSNRIDYLHITGGEDPAFKAERLCDIIAFARSRGMPVTLVLGQRSRKDYAAFADAGADAYILKLETTNRDLFSNMRLDGSLEGRVDELLLLRSLGWKIGTGVIAGLPGQTIEDLADDLNVIYKIAPDHASVSRFNRNETALLGGFPDGDVQVTLNFLALLRLSLPESVTIPGGTSLAENQSLAFEYGANVASVHITKPEYINLYSTYRSEERIVADHSLVQGFEPQR